MKISNSIKYAPKGKPLPVVEQGEFAIAAIGLEHGHINGMCNGLIEAGASLKWVYDKDESKTLEFANKFDGVRIASSEEEILLDPEVKLIASAAIPSQRCELGIRVMAAGKDYFTDKAPFTTLEQLDAARQMVKETGKKYMVYYSERIGSEAAVFAGDLVYDGAIGKVVHVLGLGPHRLNPHTRPDWFFKKETYGGILCDIGSHQIEQFLYFAGVKDATIQKSQIANYKYPEYPELDDFGDAMLVGDNGATNYFRVDWLTPDGLSSWGDGRMFIMGTDGYIEIRKNVNVGTKDNTSNHIFMVNHEGEHHFQVEGQVGCPFFGQLILDCINRTEIAMTQEHAFKAGELCVKAQLEAIKIK